MKLRTPLNAVLGFAQLLELDGLTPTRHRPTRTGLLILRLSNGPIPPGNRSAVSSVRVAISVEVQQVSLRIYLMSG